MLYLLHAAPVLTSEFLPGFLFTLTFLIPTPGTYNVVLSQWRKPIVESKVYISGFPSRNDALLKQMSQLPCGSRGT